jgi:hypothetical protein
VIHLLSFVASAPFAHKRNNGERVAQPEQQWTLAASQHPLGLRIAIHSMRPSSTSSARDELVCRTWDTTCASAHSTAASCAIGREKLPSVSMVV